MLKNKREESLVLELSLILGLMLVLILKPSAPLFINKMKSQNREFHGLIDIMNDWS